VTELRKSIPSGCQSCTQADTLYSYLFFLFFFFILLVAAGATLTTMTTTFSIYLDASWSLKLTELKTQDTLESARTYMGHLEATVTI
jgi:hypothetical protein